jgi:hypothetical protein
MEEVPKVTVASWNKTTVIDEDGNELQYPSEEFSEESFLGFANELVEYHPSFEYLLEGLSEEGMIAVGTPKPEQLEFKMDCEICGEELENRNPHISRMDESTHEFICINCFFKIPYTENQFND